MKIPVNSKICSPTTATGSRTQPKSMSRAPKRGLSEAKLSLGQLSQIFQCLLGRVFSSLDKNLQQNTQRISTKIILLDNSCISILC